MMEKIVFKFKVGKMEMGVKLVQIKISGTSVLKNVQRLFTRFNESHIKSRVKMRV